MTAWEPAAFEWLARNCQGPAAGLPAGPRAVDTLGRTVARTETSPC